MAYAVRRPVENVYLVRERDRRRSRELFGFALAAVPPVVVLFVAIWANVKTVELGYQLARLAKKREALVEMKRKLDWIAPRRRRSRGSKTSPGGRSASCPRRSTSACS